MSARPGPLWIVEPERPAAAESPELSYLSSCRELEARAIFAPVHRMGSASGVEPQPDDYALLLGGEDLLLSRRTLDAMRAALAGGAEVVAAHRLSHLNVDEPLYTLRDFERWEGRVLAAPRQPAAADLASPPLALASWRWCETKLGPEAGRRWRAGDIDGRELAHYLAAAPWIGLCHAFIDYYGETRADVLPLMPPGATEVLEIGCGRGMTGALLQERLGCRVTGVEHHPLIAAEARQRLHRVLCGDITTLELAERFDAVIAFELLEHLPDAEALLERLPKLLRPGGRALLSVPNVGHHAVVTDLLAGRWDYLPIGLLCYTHYRFFTRRTLEDWLRRCGITSFEIIPQKTELPTELRVGADWDHDSLATKGFYVVIPG